MAFLVGATPSPTVISSQRLLRLSMPRPAGKAKCLPVIASSAHRTPNPILRTLRTAVSSVVLLTATSAAIFSGRARAEDSCPPPSTVGISATSEIPEVEIVETAETKSETLALSQTLESDEKPTETLQEMIHSKVVAAKLLSSCGEVAEAREILEEVLLQDPLCLEALYEYAAVMHLSEEDSAAYNRLEEAIEIANRENKADQVREIIFMKAQMLIAQSKLEEAMRSIEGLRDEDAEDYRPHLAMGVVYSLMGQDTEAQEAFERSKEVSGGKSGSEVETFLQSGILNVRLFRTDVPGNNGDLTTVS